MRKGRLDGSLQAQLIYRTHCFPSGNLVYALAARAVNV